MQNGLSHVRKAFKLLSAEALEQVADELKAKKATAEKNLANADSTSAVGKMLSDQVEYISTVEEIVGKIQFEKLNA